MNYFNNYGSKFIQENGFSINNSYSKSRPNSNRKHKESDKIASDNNGC